MLEYAIESVEDGRKLKYLVEAAASMELLALKDELAAESTALFKNLGLAYMHMVRSKEAATKNIWKNIKKRWVL